jgi:hypothetical protein
VDSVNEVVWNTKKKMLSIDTLCNDTMGHIVTFLSLKDIYHLGQCNTYLSQLLNKDSLTWPPLLFHYSFIKEQKYIQLLLRQCNNSYKECLKRELQLSLYLSSYFKSCESLDSMINNCTHTIILTNNLLNSEWTITKVIKQIQGSVWQVWKVILDHCIDQWNICIGLHH